MTKVSHARLKVKSLEQGEGKMRQELWTGTQSKENHLKRRTKFACSYIYCQLTLILGSLRFTWLIEAGKKPSSVTDRGPAHLWRYIVWCNLRIYRVVQCSREQCCLSNGRCTGIALANYSWAINNVSCVSKAGKMHPSARHTAFPFQKALLFLFELAFSPRELCG